MAKSHFTKKEEVKSADSYQRFFIVHFLFSNRVDYSF